MKIVFTWRELIVYQHNKEVARFRASCRVRNEINGQRKKDEVVYTFPEHGKPKPYYPRQFSSGIYEITELEYTEDKEYAPVKIKTNATREVFIWDLDTNGNYWEPTGQIQNDTCYWIHYTESSTTLGCIRVNTEKEILALAELIEENTDKIYLEVL